MKIRPFALLVAPLLALAQPVAAAEPMATPEGNPPATPMATPPSAATPTPTPAADATPSPTPEPVIEASPAPAASPTAEASPTPEGAAAAPENTPTADASPAPDAATSDATIATEGDILPEPTDMNLGAPIDSGDSLPSADGTADLPDPDSLIAPPGSEPSEDVPPAPPVAQENKFEKERKLRVRYQEVKLQALKDPAIRSLHEQAEAAKTDEAKRQALREYYRMLFEKMTKIDAALGPKCDTMLQAYLRRLGQFRVTPTIPLQPPPTPAPLTN